jgi:hypothetical protein
VALAAALATAIGTPAGVAVPVGEPVTIGPESLYVVVLDGPGTSGYDGPLTDAEYRTRITQQQDAMLEQLGRLAEYRWTTALNGFAAELSADRAARLARTPGVAAVEVSAVRALARAEVATAPAARAVPGAGGDGTVVGVVDTGIDPDGPVFAGTPSLGPAGHSGFAGTCPDAEGWVRACNDKVVAARHYVRGFSADRLASRARVSPYDTHGHGTQVASLAAGNRNVTATLGARDLGTFSGAAPDARIAVYKACWTAPDPVDDGCATADLVAAIDQAVADRVDVLALAVSGSPTLDVVDRALLGAMESDIVVAAAAGNAPDAAGYGQPWTTTVGASSGPERRGELVLDDGTVLPGTMSETESVGPAPVVAASSITAPGRSRADAALCLPGSLDAARASGRIVVCERGRVARVDKSAAVRLADGAAMVLVSNPGRSPGADLHAVPSLHVSAADGAVLRRELRDGLVATLHSVDATDAVPRLLEWSAGAPPGVSTVKPDLAAAGTGLLAATTGAEGQRWELLTGTSASTALVAGTAARLRAQHPRWPAQWIRSALATSAVDLAGDPSSLRQGAGRLYVSGAVRAGLVYDVPPRAWRQVLTGALDAARLNVPSVIVDRAPRVVEVTRRVTNVTRRHMYYSSQATGFRAHQVDVRPAAVRIAPGETRTLRIRITPRGRARADSGWVAWRGANRTRVRIPVVVR